jgi:hypothetical protein
LVEPFPIECGVYVGGTTSCLDIGYIIQVHNIYNY